MFDFFRARGNLRPPFAKAMTGCLIRVAAEGVCFQSCRVSLFRDALPAARCGTILPRRDNLGDGLPAGEGICHRFPGKRSV